MQVVIGNSALTLAVPLALIALLGMAVCLAWAFTQRRRAMQGLLDVERRLAVASEMAHIVIWNCHLSHLSGAVTPSHYTTSGLAPRSAPLDQAGWIAPVHPDDRARVVQALQSAQDIGQHGYSIDVRLQQADGSHRWMREIGTPMEGDSAGKPAAMLVVRSEITQVRQAQIEREQILARVSDAFVALDRDWCFTFVNARAGKILDRNPDELVGKPLWSAFALGRDAHLQQLCETALREQQPQHAEEFHSRYGRWIENHIYPSLDGMTIYFQDITQRKESEIALRLAKDHAESLISNANVMIVALDPAGAITLFNQEAQKRTGYTMADLAGRNWFDVLCPRERYPRVWAEFQRIAQGGSPHHFENPIVTRLGEERFISWQTNVLRTDGTVTGHLSFGIDVTARLQAERALAESRDQFEALIHFSLQGVVLARNGKLVYTNPAFQALTGRNESELAGASVAELMVGVHPDDRPGSLARQQRALQGGQPHPVEAALRLRGPDGEWRWFLSSVRGITVGGEPALLAMMLDIHDRKLAEDALRSSEERFRSAFESSAIGLSLCDRQGNWLKVNPALCRIVGYTETELLALSFTTITHPEDIAQGRQFVKELYDGKRESFQMEKRYLHKDGHVVWICLTVALVLDADRNATQTVAQVEDISGRKALELDLQASQARLSATINALPDLMFEVDLAGRLHGCLSPHPDLLPYPQEQLLGELVYKFMPPEAQRSVEAGLQEARIHGHSQGQQIALPLKYGVRWFELSIARKQTQPDEGIRFIALSRDITDRKLLEKRDEQEREILHYLTIDRPLKDILEKLVLGHEAMVPGMRGSVLLLGTDGQHLRHGAAPHLDPAYCTAIDGSAIGPAAGSCGTAANTLQTVIAADIATDPRWAGYRDLAAKHGLRACWSIPIRGMQDQLLGTFAFYFDHVREPTPAEQQTLERSAQLTSQAIERNLAVRALQVSEERYRNLVEWSPEGIGVHADGVVVYVNPAAAQLWGAQSARDIVGKPVMQFVYPPDQAVLAEQTRAVLTMDAPTRLAQCRHVRLDGSIVDVEIKGGPITIGGVAAVQIVMRDVTARKRAEAEVRDSRKQLRILSSKVLAAQETERRRIAHELHDELGQALTAIKINLLADNQLGQEAHAALQAENVRIVESALQQVRSLALALRPSMLDDLGLVPALRWLADQTAQRNGLQLALDVTGSVRRLETDLETAVFRILQEALTNVVRHAQASKIRLTVQMPVSGTVLAQLQDDGIGFDVARMHRRALSGNSMGILGMQERASLAGIDLSIDAAPGNGCTITLRCPCHAHVASA